MKIDKVDLLVNQFLKQGIDFELTKTATTAKIKLSDGRKISSVNPTTKLNVWELNLISSVKRYNADKISPILHKPLYIDITKTIGIEKDIKNCVEIDLNAAYWNKALELGYINKEIYDKAYSKNVAKKARLIALGALAKTSYIYDGKNGELILRERKREQTAGIFFHIASEVSIDMFALSYSLNTFIFFWVDAVFFEISEFKKAVSIAENLGYEIKYYICELIEILHDRIIVHSTAHKEKERIFFKNKKTR